MGWFLFMTNPSTKLQENWCNTFWDILATDRQKKKHMWKHNLHEEVIAELRNYESSIGDQMPIYKLINYINVNQANVLDQKFIKTLLPLFQVGSTLQKDHFDRDHPKIEINVVCYVGYKSP